MNALSFIAGVAAPHDLWTILMNWIQGAVGNMGWTILLVTLLVKVATLPLDFAVKYTTKQQTLIQQKCSPQIAKLQKKYGNDRQTLQIQTQAIYKREGMKTGTSCLVMLVNIILTFAIFISFYGTLRTVSAYEAINQYEHVYNAYDAKYYETLIAYSNDDVIIDKTTANAEIIKFNNALTFISDTSKDQTTDEYKAHKNYYDSNIEKFQAATDEASDAAVQKWGDVNSSWLWVQNIWVADSPTNPFPTYTSLKSIASNGGKEYKEYVETNISETNYNKIAGLMDTVETKANGYYILAVLAGAITFLSQYISELHNRLKNKNANKLAKASNAQNTMTMKVMKFVMPLVMVMFVLSASASFGIYILASNIASIAFGEVVTLIINRLTRNKQQEVEAALEKEANRMIKKGQLQG